MKVLDFCSDNEALAFPSNILIKDTVFYVLVRRNGKIKELPFFIPKKYKFKRSLVSSDFKAGKLREYNVIIDFLRFSKSAVQARFNLTDLEYEDLLIGLKATLIREYMCEGTSVFKKLLRFKEVIAEFIKLYFCNAFFR